jgi:hypothetical protein
MLGPTIRFSICPYYFKHSSPVAVNIFEGSGMFTTNSLCLIIFPVYKWRQFFFFFILKVIFLLSPFENFIIRYSIQELQGMDCSTVTEIFHHHGAETYALGALITVRICWT